MNRFSDIDCSFEKLTPVYGYRSQKLVTIEKALESIQSQIDELPYYIETAKKHCHYPSEHGLTHDESASVYIYTMEWGEQTLYRVLNKALRNENRHLLKVWFPYLKLFDTALNKLPTAKEVVWRGITADIGKNFHENGKITWWSINSCSSKVNVIKGFLGNEKNSTTFLIEALNGKKVSGYTEHESEDEIILRMGTEFRVKSNALDHPNGSYLVHLIEIDEKNNDNNHTSTSGWSLVSAIYQTFFPAKTNQISSKSKFKKWKQNAITVAGENGKGQKLNQLYHPLGLFIDEKKSIFITDYGSHRIVEWKCNTKEGQIIAGGNGQGNRKDQLNRPTNMIVDQQDHSIIIADSDNRRVIQWLNKKQQILIDNIDCSRLAIDKHGFLYVSDWKKNEVRRWKMGEYNNEGIVVAGGNEEGNKLNRLSRPGFIFVDEDQSVYVSDRDNHRVIQWRKDAKEGRIVAGGNGKGGNLNQLSEPEGVIVDDLGQLYVAEYGNHRVMRWCEGKEEGEVVVGGNGEGNQSDQLNGPRGLSFDNEENLYVVDKNNHRIQKYEKLSN
ncbi:unnamed protein product [Adineta steineri]|uniref:NAD(P)(+)--arginine ADP-ribosyltransferase n=1 Tax=Adineta steineri TaxID=433720 RepID=A0A815ZTC5_9BILA|nr:unnamed protein product [Adineta steineri]CAF1586905.1 unnamed protein product [Adineta steineri]